jgi:hypothetical protein
LPTLSTHSSISCSSPTASSVSKASASLLFKLGGVKVEIVMRTSSGAGLQSQWVVRFAVLRVRGAYAHAPRRDHSLTVGLIIWNAILVRDLLAYGPAFWVVTPSCALRCFLRGWSLPVVVLLV